MRNNTLFYKGKSALYRRMSTELGFTDIQILRLIGVKMPKTRTKEKINKIFTHEKDYLTLNVCEVIAQAFYHKKLADTVDDAFSLVLHDVRICRDKPHYVGSSNEMTINYARGKMVNRKNKIYKTELDVLDNKKESIFKPVNSDSSEEECD
jgi:hypothetical protein